nr:hypothetical protein [Tanacetum cinerariifolium]
MENANPPPTNNRLVLSAVLRVKVVQELYEIQVFLATTLPPPTNVRKRTYIQALAGESASKKRKCIGGSSSGAAATRESASKADDALSTQIGSSKTLTSLSFASTHSEPLVFARPGPRSEPVSHHISKIVFDLVKAFSKTLHEDRFYASMSVDPSFPKYIYHLDWELRDGPVEVGFSGGERRGGAPKEAGGGIESGGWQTKVKVEFAQMLDGHQRRFDERVAALDARLDKMVQETDEEFAPMLRGVRETKKFLIGKGFTTF